MSKNNESENYLEKLLEASQEAKTIKELSEISKITQYRIYTIFKEFPVQKLIITKNLDDNKERKTLTKEQKEIYDMFMKMAEERKKIATTRVNSNSNNHYKVANTLVKTHRTYISLPFMSSSVKNTVCMNLKNDSYNFNRVMTDSGFEKTKTGLNTTLLHIGDNIYSIRFFFNNGENNCLSFKHLKIRSLLQKNNTEVIYSKSIRSYSQLGSVNEMYQRFIKRFIDTNRVSF